MANGRGNAEKGKKRRHRGGKEEEGKSRGTVGEKTTGKAQAQN
jgi:hypothetical protein